MSTASATTTGAPAVWAGTNDREPALDGIRGIAILLVLAHHVVIYAGMARDNLVDRTVFTLGASTWLGVDLFFVLSGFLITGILYDTRRSSRYFVSFYGRRVLRIFPLYYGFLILAVVILPRWLPSPTAAAMAADQAWYWLYLSNVQVARDGWQEPLHLSHFWSLAVEEQFYLLWPLIVVRCSRHRLMQIAAICFVTALGLRIVGPFIGLSAVGAHVLMPTRMDALAAGALLALAGRAPGGLQRLRRPSLQVLGGCLLAAAAIFLWRRGFGEVDRVVGTIGLSVFAAGFACWIAVTLTAPRDARLRRCLGSAPLVILGQYSYGIYVFHQPMALVCRDLGLQAGLVPRLGGSELPGLAVFALIVGGISIACAAVSWHAWEQPFIRLKRYLPYLPGQPTAPALVSTSTNLPLSAAADDLSPLACRDVRSQ